MLNDLRPGLKFNHYQLLEPIGTGGQAIVWSAEDSHRRDIVAIKFNEVPEESQEQVDDAVLEQQLKKLATLRHPHILPVYDYGLVGQVRYLVSPYLAGGSLYEKIREKPMPFADILRYILEIASALDFLHQNQIVHRDLKPSNVLLDLHQRSYLSDFGLARTVSTTTQAMHTGRGTPPYSPPEQHKQLVVTAKSDIFSFGVMLYELFTGQLPWNGERMLGMQQLYTKAEMPDPCEINPDLPSILKDALRRITSADPAHRPSSTRDVVRMIDYVFNTNGSSMLELQGDPNNDIVSMQDAPLLLEQKFPDWNSNRKQPVLGPTRFAMVHLYRQKMKEAPAAGSLAQFLLYHSLTYGYQDEEWWGGTSDPRDRAAVVLALLEGKNEVIAARVIKFLSRDRSILPLLRTKASSLSTRLLELAFGNRNPAFSSQLLSGVRLIAPRNTKWNDAVLEPAQGASLGKAALDESDLGAQAVSLIGHVRSRSAVEFVLKNAEHSRLSSILLEIQNAAGDLPSFIGGGIRARVLLEWINQQLTAQSARLATGYATALLGSTMGIASQIYLTYRLPNFLDLTRISSSLIQGLIIGFIFSFGIFFSRLAVERFETASFPLRFVLASIFGALGMSSALLLFHILYLNTIPSGYLIPLGCFMIACSYSIGGLIRWRAVKMMVSTAAVFSAIVGSWWIHRIFSTSITDLTPLFLYDYAWPPVQIILTALFVAAWMGIFGNTPPLNIQKQAGD